MRALAGAGVAAVVLLTAGALPAFSSANSAAGTGVTVTRLTRAVGETASGSAHVVRAIPFRVPDPAAYGQAKATAARRYELWRQRHGLAPAPTPPAPTPAPAPSTSVSGSLNAPGISDPTGTPSDSTGAIGPSNYVEFINSEIGVYSNTNLSAPTSTLGESSFVGDPSVFTCDPQIQWDEQGQRWLYAAIYCGTSHGSQKLYFGWSKTSSPDLAASNWCQYSLNTGDTIEDYPKLGHDNSQIIIGTNTFSDRSQQYGGSYIFVFDKPANGVTTCPSGTTETGNVVPYAVSSSDFTPVPANIADSSATGYVVAARSYSDMSHLDVYTIGRDAGNNTVVSGPTSVSVPAFAMPASVPQPGTSDVLDSSDTRLTQAVAITDPSTGKEGIWTQHTVAGSGGGPSVVRWYELTPGTSTPTQTGTVSGPSGAFAFNGAVSPSADGQDAAVFYNSGSSSRLVDWRVQDRHADTAAGTTIEDLQLATSAYADSDFSCGGSSSPCRWGDYAGASPDPGNSCRVWGTGMLTARAPDSGGTPQWGTQNAAIDVCPPVTHTLSVSKSGSGTGTVTSSPGGISCGSTCSSSFASGTSVTLTASPATGSSFAGWSGGGCSGTGTCTVTMSADTSVTATFDPAYVLTVSKSGSGLGTVTSSPAGIDCGSTCSASYQSGTSVTLTASPATGSSFAGWSGGGCSGTSTCAVTMDQARSVTATFTVISETLTVTTSGGGTGTVTSSPGGIDCGSTCSAGFAYGTSVTLTASPSTGSSFAGWSGACTGTGTCAVTMDQARSVTATFTVISETLTVTTSGGGTGTVTSSPAGIDCGSTCSAGFAYGTSVTLTASAGTGSTFVGWSGGGCSGASTCTVTMDQARSVTAGFNLLSETLSVSRSGSGTGTVTSSPAGISCGSTCSHSYAYGTSVILTAIAATGSTFAGWSGACTNSTGSCTVMMDQAWSVTATFGLIPETLTVTRSGGGTGTVTSSPAGIDCGSTCSYAYDYGTKVTLTATPAAGDSFAGWSGGGCSGTGTCAVTMDQARSVTATFDPVPSYVLSVSKSGSGSGTVTSSPAGISCGSTCSYSYESGTSVTLTASPATGSSFAGWSGACTGTGSCTVTMDQARSVTAGFNLIPESLSVSKSGSGSGTVTSSPAGIDCGSACSHAYPYGTTVTLTAVPATGSSFSGWSGACSGTGACTVTMSQARSVTVVFSLIPETLTVTRSGAGAGTVTSSLSGISCGSSCSHSYAYGTSVTLTASAGTGAIFAGWSGACSGTGACTVTMSQARSVTAGFSLIPETLTVGKKGHGRGKVTSSPAGISCGKTCSHSYDYGSLVTLTAKVARGSSFAGWSGPCSGKRTCTVTLTAARFVRASFHKICLVPKVKGKRLRVAKRRIKAHGCRVGKIKRVFSGKVKKGHVIAQKPRPHRRRRHGARIKLLVSEGRKH